MKIIQYLLLFLILSATSFAVIDLLAIQGNIYQNGIPLDSGNVSVFIYDAASGGDLLWNQTYTDEIVNGTYDIVMGSEDTNNLSLTYGSIYYLDIQINDVDQNFSGSDRQQFQASIGNITSAKISDDAVNTSQIANDAITSEKIQDAGINGVDINLSSINTSHILDGTITAADFVSDLGLGWANLTGYPVACFSGGFVTEINDTTLTCSAPIESDPFWAANESRVTNLETSNTTTNTRIDSINTTAQDLLSSNTTTNERIDNLNSTKLDATDQRFNESGTCSAGTVVQNISSSGAQCVTPLFSYTETDPSWAANSSAVARAGTCSGSTVVQNTTTSGVDCFTPSLPDHTHDATNITSGTLPVGRGCTGLTSYTTGDILYADSTTTLNKLSIASGVLIGTGAIPAWGTVTSALITDGTIAAGDLGTTIWNANGLRTNDLSTTDFDAATVDGVKGLLVLGTTSGTGTACNTMCSNHNLTCIASYGASGTVGACNTGSGARYCWCGSPP